ncbi:MAG: DUF359 domain-containing protein [Promethearchaeota archaeon]
MDYNLRIPWEKRYKFAEPLDKLIAGTRENTLEVVDNLFKRDVKSGENFNFYIVGDVVTKDFLANPFLSSFVKTCIIDQKTQRGHINVDFEDFFAEIIEFRNPKGTIQKECWFLLRTIVKSKKRTLLKITEGEEDLLVLPLILELPIEEGVKNFVFYGQPPITDSKLDIPEGIVIVEVNAANQNKVKEYINIMEKF